MRMKTPNPVEHAGKIIADARKALDEGAAIVANAKTEVRPRREAPAYDLPSPQEDLPSPEIMLASISDQLARGCTITAGLGLIKLRQWFDEHGGVPKGERTWPDYVAKHLPHLGLAKAEELAGRILHRGGILRCTKCGVQSECRCGCGAPYAPAQGWPIAIEPAAASAQERAAAALAAHPERSDRALAAEIGVGKDTVRRARAALAERPGACATYAPPDSRIGRDGKNYHLGREAS